MLIQDLILELKRLKKLHGKDVHVSLIEELEPGRFNFADLKVMSYGRPETGETCVLLGAKELETTISIRLQVVPKPELKVVK